MTPTERDRVRALLAAIQAEPSGPNLVGRVRARQAELLAAARPAPGAKRVWLPIAPADLQRQVDQLGGLASAARHLGLVPTTIRRWRLKGRIPAIVAARITALIAGGAKSLRKPNRGIDRHYVDRG